MKKTIICAIAALFMAPLIASAQSGQSATKPYTEANHSVSLDLLGLHYGYELPLWRTGTIIGRVGANFGITGQTTRGGDWRTGTGVPWGDYWMVAPSIELEPRWYYGLDRRDRHGRSTFGNAGSFVSLNVQNRFPGYISDKGFDMYGVTFFSPTWGLRRVWRDHWMFEFTTGVRFGVTHNGGYWWNGDADGGVSWANRKAVIDHINVNVRFGYSF